MSKYTGGPISPYDGNDDEWEDLVFANSSAGTINAQRNKRTGQTVLPGAGTINPGFVFNVLPEPQGPISMTELPASPRQVNYGLLNPKDDDDVRQACIDWAKNQDNGGKMYHKEMTEFLIEKFGDYYGIPNMPVNTFKHKLKHACDNGVIRKGENGRYTLQD